MLYIPVYLFLCDLLDFKLCHHSTREQIDLWILNFEKGIVIQVPEDRFYEDMKYKVALEKHFLLLHIYKLMYMYFFSVYCSM